MISISLDDAWRWFLIFLLAAVVWFAWFIELDGRETEDRYFGALSEFNECIYIARERVQATRDLVDSALLYGREGDS